MAMKGYSTPHRSLELEPRHQKQFRVIHRSLLFGGVLSLCRTYNLYSKPC